MRQSALVLALASLVSVSVASAASTDRAAESSRPKDYSRDFQVAAAPLAPNGTAVLSETFDAGIPGGWTVIDNAGSGLVWTNLAGCGESNYILGATDVACASSDDFGPADFDTELRTPVVNLSTYTAPASLTFDANYQNFVNADFFQVDVSTNGGASWTNLLSWNEDHGASFAQPGVSVSLDISAYAGQASVQFRFRYFDPTNEDWDWYIQVDNVVVNATPAGGCTLTLACPGNQFAAAPPGAGGTSVSYPAPITGGTCTSPTVSCVPASGDFFATGTTTVACSAVDGAATAECTFDVTVDNATIQEIPTASSLGLAALALLLAGAALIALRRGA